MVFSEVEGGKEEIKAGENNLRKASMRSFPGGEQIQTVAATVEWIGGKISAGGHGVRR